MGLPTPSLEKAKRPILASRAARPNGRPAQVVPPSVEYWPVTFVPSDCRRSQKSSGKSAARFAVESSAALRATLLTSLMNSNFSANAEPEPLVAMRPNFVKFASSP